MVGLGASALLGYALFSYGLGVASEHLTHRVREQTFSSLVRHSIGWFEDLNQSSVMLSNTLEQDACKLSRAVGPATTDKLRVLVNIGKVMCCVSVIITVITVVSFVILATKVVVVIYPVS